MRYAEYYELSEKNGWRTTDLDWSALRRDQDEGKISEVDRGALLGPAVIEYGVPHYAEVWTLVSALRDDWELWQFTTLWTGEEHRHSFALGKACATLDIAGDVASDIATVTHAHFAEAQKRACPSNCLSTIPGMLSYAMIQELATQKFHTIAAKRTESPFLRRLWSLIAADEMRHHVFYKEHLQGAYQAAADQPWYVEQVYAATRSFKMPHQIYGVQSACFDHDFGIGESMMPQLARCFAFDLELLGRLAAAHSASPV